MVRKLYVTRIPRSDPIPDRPINFPPLGNLHLELLENKKKLKQGAPLIPSSTKRPKHVPSLSDKVTVSEKSESEPQTPKQSTMSGKSSSSAKSGKKKRKKIVEDDDEEEEDEDMIADLAEEGDDDDIEAELGEDGDEDDEEEEGEEGEEEEEEEEDDPYAGLSPEEREAMEKEEYIWRFRILKKKYKSPSVEIPIYNEHSDLTEMKTSYNRTIKELTLDDNVESYRTYLVGGWIVMEFACTQWVGIDLTGFTLQQTKMMYKYDRLLIELGERSYNQWGSNIPVEVRLIFMIMIQAGMFYLAKVISTKFGNNVAELFKGFTGQPPDAVPSSEEKPKRRMRGPKIKAEEIREMHKNKI